jgi:hypothetical protein
VRHGVHGVRGRRWSACCVLQASRYTPHVASCVLHVDFRIVCCR